jgi:hypothetical protein
MTSQSEDDFLSQFQQLKTEASSPVAVVTDIEPVTETIQTCSGDATRIAVFLNWLNNLSGIQKLVVTIASVIFGFAILQAVLKLIASVLSMALFAALAFVGYKFFVASK